MFLVETDAPDGAGGMNYHIYPLGKAVTNFEAAQVVIFFRGAIMSDSETPRAISFLYISLPRKPPEPVSKIFLPLSSISIET